MHNAIYYDVTKEQQSQVTDDSIKPAKKTILNARSTNDRDKLSNQAGGLNNGPYHYQLWNSALCSVDILQLSHKIRKLTTSKVRGKGHKAAINVCLSVISREFFIMSK